MRIEELQIEGFRNIAKARLDLAAGFNALAGRNGAGKTSVLEAIYALGYGRSFRSRLTEPLIRQGEQEYLVFAKGRSADGNEHRFGLSKDLQSLTRIHIDGQPAQSLGELARLFPVLEIDAASFELVDGGPAGRRAYLDWGVFHVEQQSSALWSRFRRVLQQRNSLLKSKAAVDWAYWDGEFVRLSEAVDQARTGYLLRLTPVLQEQIGRLLEAGLALDIDYHPGWSRGGESLAEQLARGRQREQALGRTLKGAQMADLQLSLGGVSARDRLSRGQKKLLIAALKFAQLRLYNSAHAETCVLLLDDFPAELDEASMKRIREQLAELQCQVIAAAIEPADLVAMNPWPEPRMFHVEQGQIQSATEIS